MLSSKQNTNIPIPDWENISAVVIARVLEFKYTECVLMLIMFLNIYNVACFLVMRQVISGFQIW
jgi:hypothetical protein